MFKSIFVILFVFRSNQIYYTLNYYQLSILFFQYLNQLINGTLQINAR